MTTVNEILLSLGFSNSIEEIKRLLLENGTNQYEPSKNGNGKFSKFGENSFHILQAINALSENKAENARSVKNYIEGDGLTFMELVSSIRENGFDLNRKIKVSFQANDNTVSILDGYRRFLAMLYILVDGIKNGNLDAKFASFLNTVPCEYGQNNMTKNEIFGQQLRYGIENAKIDNVSFMSLIYRFIENDESISTKTVLETLKIKFISKSWETKISQFRKFSHIEPIREKFFRYEISLIDAYNFVLNEKETIQTLEKDEIDKHFSDKFAEIEKVVETENKKENKPLKLKVEKKPKETPKQTQEEPTPTKTPTKIESEESFLYKNINTLFDVLAVSEHKQMFKAIKVLLEKGQDAEIQKTVFSQILGVSKVPEMVLQPLEETEEKQETKESERKQESEENEIDSILQKLEDETTKESTRLSEICVNFDNIFSIESHENLLFINDKNFQMTSNTEAKAFEIFLKDLYAVK